MRLTPTYFEVTKPFRYYRQIGITRTNTYIGSSQVFDNVYEVLNAKVGDVVNDLPGGQFMVEADGRVSPMEVMAPKHIFEAKYGHGAERAKQDLLVKNGYLTPIPKPERSIDYIEVRKRTGVEFAPHSEALIVLEASPELQAYRENAKSLFTTWRDDVVLTDFDSFEDLTVGSVVEDAQGRKARLTWMFVQDFYTVKPYGERPELFEPLYEQKRFSLADLEDVLSGEARPAAGMV